GLDLAAALRAACVVGRAAIGLAPGGTIAAGAPADLLLLDLDGLDRDGVMPVDPRELLFTRAKHAHLVEVVVAGHTVARDGRPLAVDLEAVHDELRAAYRAGLAHGNDALAAWPALEPRLAAFYRDQLGCGCP
ncbi:MAG: amidohydrolase family protein, partial [Alphaproteobacteria bacterium]